MVIKVLKFGATWCMPCKVLNEFFDEIKKEVSENVIYNSYDQELDSKYFELYNIKSMPTIVITDNNNNELDRIIGLASKNVIVKTIKKYQ